MLAQLVASCANLTGELVYQLGQERSAVLRFSEGQNALSLDLLLVPSELRDTGVGSMLLARLLALADRTGKPVRTTARPIGQNNPQTLARLVRFYERFGFCAEHEAVDRVTMRRPPPGAGRHGR